MLCYSNNGFSFRAVDSSYVAQQGEVIFDVDHVTPAELAAAFPEYSATALNLVQANQIAIISSSAAAAYVAGFESSASGSPMWYDSDTDTQTVINRQFQIALAAPTIYAATTFFAGAPVGVTPVRAKGHQSDPDSAKTVQYLTAAQMVVLGNDLATAWAEVKGKLWTLQAEINAATTAAAVQAVAW